MTRLEEIAWELDELDEIISGAMNKKKQLKQEIKKIKEAMRNEASKGVVKSE